MVQIVHRNYPFAICFNLAYFVSCCNDNRIRLQEICWSTVLWYLPSVYGWLKIKYLSTLKYHVFPVMFQIQSCNQKVRKMPSNPNTQCVQLTWNKRIAMWFAVAESSCFLLYGLLALWTRPIGSSMSGTLVGTWWCCLLKKLEVRRLVPDTTKKIP